MCSTSQILNGLPNCIQASPALRGSQGISVGGPEGRLAAPTEKEIAFIDTNL